MPDNDNIWFWTSDGHEPQTGPGWYPVHWPYDTHEGIFPDAAYWSGERWFGSPKYTILWDKPPPIYAFIPIRFVNWYDAKRFADLHDMDL